MKTTLKISEIVTEWLDGLDVVELTRRSYRAKLELWFRYLTQRKVDVRAPRRINAIEYKRALEADGKSVLTVDSYITVVKIFYKHIEEQGYAENIAAGIRSSHQNYEHRRSPLTAPQASELLASIDTSTLKGVRDKMMIVLMLLYGLRACEVARISSGDIVKQNDMNYLRLMRKGRREKREMIAVSDDVYNLYLTLSDGLNDNEPLVAAFGGRCKGSRLKQMSIGRIAKARLRAIGIDRKDVSGHSLRHTCASLLISSGVALEDVRDVLGHASTSTTRLYVKEAQRAKILQNNPSILLEKKLM